MSDRRPVVDIDAVPAENSIAPDRNSGFGSRTAGIGFAPGMEKLDRSSCRRARQPYYPHHAREELLAVLSGEGTLRHLGARDAIGPDETSSRPGPVPTARTGSSTRPGMKRAVRPFAPWNSPKSASIRTAAMSRPSTARRPHPLFFMARRADALDYRHDQSTKSCAARQTSGAGNMVRLKGLEPPRAYAH